MLGFWHFLLLSVCLCACLLCGTSYKQHCFYGLHICLLCQTRSISNRIPPGSPSPLHCQVLSTGTSHLRVFSPLGGASSFSLMALEGQQVSGHLVTIGADHSNATLCSFNRHLMSTCYVQCRTQTLPNELR